MASKHFLTAAKSLMLTLGTVVSEAILLPQYKQRGYNGNGGPSIRDFFNIMADFRTATLDNYTRRTIQSDYYLQNERDNRHSTDSRCETVAATQ